MAEIDSEFMRVLGRAPTDAERRFFDKFIQENDLTPYDVGQIIESSAEASRRSLPGDVAGLRGALAEGDEEVLGRAQTQLRGEFYRQGRPLSSGYTAAFANAARDLALARQPSVADFYTRALFGARGQSAAAGAGRIERGYGLRDERRKRAYELEDYYRQQNDFNSYLSGQESRNLRGSLRSAGIGFGTRLLGGAIGGLAGRYGGGGGTFGEGFLGAFGGGGR